ncbi:MAG: hypothetical protein HYZ83_04230, partial [Candidatus Omnitrophica bacterium]|nr:hypothetical protein [Candidatus Omnitrophota bacterium]
KFQIDEIYWQQMQAAGIAKEGKLFDRAANKEGTPYEIEVVKSNTKQLPSETQPQPSAPTAHPGFRTDQSYKEILDDLVASGGFVEDQSPRDTTFGETLDSRSIYWDSEVAEKRFTLPVASINHVKLSLGKGNRDDVHPENPRLVFNVATNTTHPFYNITDIDAPSGRSVFEYSPAPSGSNENGFWIYQDPRTIYQIKFKKGELWFLIKDLKDEDRKKIKDQEFIFTKGEKTGRLTLKFVTLSEANASPKQYAGIFDPAGAESNPSLGPASELAAGWLDLKTAEDVVRYLDSRGDFYTRDSSVPNMLTWKRGKETVATYETETSRLSIDLRFMLLINGIYYNLYVLSSANNVLWTTLKRRDDPAPKNIISKPLNLRVMQKKGELPDYHFLVENSDIVSELPGMELGKPIPVVTSSGKPLGDFVTFDQLYYSEMAPTRDLFQVVALLWSPDAGLFPHVDSPIGRGGYKLREDLSALTVSVPDGGQERIVSKLNFEKQASTNPDPSQAIPNYQARDLEMDAMALKLGAGFISLDLNKLIEQSGLPKDSSVMGWFEVFLNEYRGMTVNRLKSTASDTILIDFHYKNLGDLILRLKEFLNFNPAFHAYVLKRMEDVLTKGIAFEGNGRKYLISFKFEDAIPDNAFKTDSQSDRPAAAVGDFETAQKPPLEILIEELQELGMETAGINNVSEFITKLKGQEGMEGLTPEDFAQRMVLLGPWADKELGLLTDAVLLDRQTNRLMIVSGIFRDLQAGGAVTENMTITDIRYSGPLSRYSKAWLDPETNTIFFLDNDRSLWALEADPVEFRKTRKKEAGMNHPKYRVLWGDTETQSAGGGSPAAPPAGAMTKPAATPEEIVRVLIEKGGFAENYQNDPFYKNRRKFSNAQIGETIWNPPDSGLNMEFAIPEINSTFYFRNVGKLGEPAYLDSSHPSIGGTITPFVFYEFEGFDIQPGAGGKKIYVFSWKTAEVTRSALEAIAELSLGQGTESQVIESFFKGKFKSGDEYQIKIGNEDLLRVQIEQTFFAIKNKADGRSAGISSDRTSMASALLFSDLGNGDKVKIIKQILVNKLGYKVVPRADSLILASSENPDSGVGFNLATGFQISDIQSDFPISSLVHPISDFEELWMGGNDHDFDDLYLVIKTKYNGRPAAWRIMKDHAVLDMANREPYDQWWEAQKAEWNLRPVTSMPPVSPAQTAAVLRAGSSLRAVTPEEIIKEFTEKGGFTKPFSSSSGLEEYGKDKVGQVIWIPRTRFWTIKLSPAQMKGNLHINQSEVHNYAASGKRVAPFSYEGFEGVSIQPEPDGKKNHVFFWRKAKVQSIKDLAILIQDYAVLGKEAKEVVEFFFQGELQSGDRYKIVVGNEAELRQEIEKILADLDNLGQILTPSQILLPVLKDWDAVHQAFKPLVKELLEFTTPERKAQILAPENIDRAYKEVIENKKKGLQFDAAIFSSMISELIKKANQTDLIIPLPLIELFEAFLAHEEYGERLRGSRINVMIAKEAEKSRRQFAQVELRAGDLKLPEISADDALYYQKMPPTLNPKILFDLLRASNEGGFSRDKTSKIERGGILPEKTGGYLGSGRKEFEEISLAVPDAADFSLFQFDIYRSKDGLEFYDTMSGITRNLDFEANYDVNFSGDSLLKVFPIPASNDSRPFQLAITGFTVNRYVKSGMVVINVYYQSPDYLPEFAQQAAALLKDFMFRSKQGIIYKIGYIPVPSSAPAPGTGPKSEVASPRAAARISKLAVTHEEIVREFSEKGEFRENFRSTPDRRVFGKVKAGELVWITRQGFQEEYLGVTMEPARAKRNLEITLGQSGTENHGNIHSFSASGNRLMPFSYEGFEGVAVEDLAGGKKMYMFHWKKAGIRIAKDLAALVKDHPDLSKAAVEIFFQGKLKSGDEYRIVLGNETELRAEIAKILADPKNFESEFAPLEVLMAALTDTNAVRQAFAPFIEKLLDPAVTNEQKAEILSPTNIDKAYKEARGSDLVYLQHFVINLIRAGWKNNMLIPLPLIELFEAFLAHEDYAEILRAAKIDILINQEAKKTRDQLNPPASNPVETGQDSPSASPRLVDGELEFGSIPDFYGYLKKEEPAKLDNGRVVVKLFDDSKASLWLQTHHITFSYKTSRPGWYFSPVDNTNTLGLGFHSGSKQHYEDPFFKFEKSRLKIWYQKNPRENGQFSYRVIVTLTLSPEQKQKLSEVLDEKAVSLDAWLKPYASPEGHRVELVLAEEQKNPPQAAAPIHKLAPSFSYVELSPTKDSQQIWEALYEPDEGPATDPNSPKARGGHKINSSDGKRLEVLDEQENRASHFVTDSPASSKGRIDFIGPFYSIFTGSNPTQPFMGTMVVDINILNEMAGLTSAETKANGDLTLDTYRGANFRTLSDYEGVTVNRRGNTILINFHYGSLDNSGTRELLRIMYPFITESFRMFVLKRLEDLFRNGISFQSNDGRNYQISFQFKEPIPANAFGYDTDEFLNSHKWMFEKSGLKFAREDASQYYFFRPIPVWPQGGIWAQLSNANYRFDILFARNQPDRKVIGYPDFESGHRMAGVNFNEGHTTFSFLSNPAIRYKGEAVRGLDFSDQSGTWVLTNEAFDFLADKLKQDQKSRDFTLTLTDPDGKIYLLSIIAENHPRAEAIIAKNQAPTSSTQSPAAAVKSKVNLTAKKKPLTAITDKLRQIQPDDDTLKELQEEMRQPFLDNAIRFAEDGEISYLRGYIYRTFSGVPDFNSFRFHPARDLIEKIGAAPPPVVREKREFSEILDWMKQEREIRLTETNGGTMTDGMMYGIEWVKDSAPAIKFAGGMVSPNEFSLNLNEGWMIAKVVRQILFEKGKKTRLSVPTSRRVEDEGFVDFVLEEGVWRLYVNEKFYAELNQTNFPLAGYYKKDGVQFAFEIIPVVSADAAANQAREKSAGPDLPEDSGAGDKAVAVLTGVMPFKSIPKLYEYAKKNGHLKKGDLLFGSNEADALNISSDGKAEQIELRLKDALGWNVFFSKARSGIWGKHEYPPSDDPKITARAGLWPRAVSIFEMPGIKERLRLEYQREEDSAGNPKIYLKIILELTAEELARFYEAYQNAELYKVTFSKPSFENWLVYDKDGHHVEIEIVDASQSRKGGKAPKAKISKGSSSTAGTAAAKPFEVDWSTVGEPALFPATIAELLSPDTSEKRWQEMLQPKFINDFVNGTFKAADSSYFDASIWAIYQSAEKQNWQHPLILAQFLDALRTHNINARDRIRFAQHDPHIDELLEKARERENQTGAEPASTKPAPGKGPKASLTTGGVLKTIDEIREYFALKAKRDKNFQKSPLSDDSLEKWFQKGGNSQGVAFERANREKDKEMNQAIFWLYQTSSSRKYYLLGIRIDEKAGQVIFGLQLKNPPGTQPDAVNIINSVAVKLENFKGIRVPPVHEAFYFEFIFDELPEELVEALQNEGLKPERWNVPALGQTWADLTVVDPEVEAWARLPIQTGTVPKGYSISEKAMDMTDVLMREFPDEDLLKRKISGKKYEIVREPSVDYQKGGKGLLLKTLPADQDQLGATQLELVTKSSAGEQRFHSLMAHPTPNPLGQGHYGSFLTLARVLSGGGAKDDLRFGYSNWEFEDDDIPGQDLGPKENLLGAYLVAPEDSGKNRPEFYIFLNQVTEEMILGLTTTAAALKRLEETETDSSRGRKSKNVVAKVSSEEFMFENENLKYVIRWNQGPETSASGSEAPSKSQSSDTAGTGGSDKGSLSVGISKSLVRAVEIWFGRNQDNFPAAAVTLMGGTDQDDFGARSLANQTMRSTFQFEPLEELPDGKNIFVEVRRHDNPSSSMVTGSRIKIVVYYTPSATEEGLLGDLSGKFAREMIENQKPAETIRQEISDIFDNLPALSGESEASVPPLSAKPEVLTDNSEMNEEFFKAVKAWLALNKTSFPQVTGTSSARDVASKAKSGINSVELATIPSEIDFRESYSLPNPSRGFSITSIRSTPPDLPSTVYRNYRLKIQVLYNSRAIRENVLAVLCDFLSARMVQDQKPPEMIRQEILGTLETSRQFSQVPKNRMQELIAFLKSRQMQQAKPENPIIFDLTSRDWDFSVWVDLENLAERSTLFTNRTNVLLFDPESNFIFAKGGVDISYTHLSRLSKAWFDPSRNAVLLVEKTFGELFEINLTTSTFKSIGRKESELSKAADRIELWDDTTSRQEGSAPANTAALSGDQIGELFLNAVKIWFAENNENFPQIIRRSSEPWAIAESGRASTVIEVIPSEISFEEESSLPEPARLLMDIEENPRPRSDSTDTYYEGSSSKMKVFYSGRTNRMNWLNQLSGVLAEKMVENKKNPEVISNEILRIHQALAEMPQVPENRMQELIDFLKAEGMEQVQLDNLERLKNLIARNPSLDGWVDKEGLLERSVLYVAKKPQFVDDKRDKALLLDPKSNVIFVMTNGTLSASGSTAELPRYVLRDMTYYYLGSFPKMWYDPNGRFLFARVFSGQESKILAMDPDTAEFEVIDMTESELESVEVRLVRLWDDTKAGTTPPTPVSKPVSLAGKALLTGNVVGVPANGVNLMDIRRLDAKFANTSDKVRKMFPSDVRVGTRDIDGKKAILITDTNNTEILGFLRDELVIRNNTRWNDKVAFTLKSKKNNFWLEVTLGGFLDSFEFNRPSATRLKAVYFVLKQDSSIKKNELYFFFESVNDLTRKFVQSFKQYLNEKNFGGQILSEDSSDNFIAENDYLRLVLAAAPASLLETEAQTFERYYPADLNGVLDYLRYEGERIVEDKTWFAFNLAEYEEERTEKLQLPVPFILDLDLVRQVVAFLLSGQDSNLFLKDESKTEQADIIDRVARDFDPEMLAYRRVAQRRRSEMRNDEDNRMLTEIEYGKESGFISSYDVTPSAEILKKIGLEGSEGIRKIEVVQNPVKKPGDNLFIHLDAEDILYSWDGLSTELGELGFNFQGESHLAIRRTNEDGTVDILIRESLFDALSADAVRESIKYANVNFVKTPLPRLTQTKFILVTPSVIGRNYGIARTIGILGAMGYKVFVPVVKVPGTFQGDRQFFEAYHLAGLVEAGIVIPLEGTGAELKQEITRAAGRQLKTQDMVTLSIGDELNEEELKKYLNLKLDEDVLGVSATKRADYPVLLLGAKLQAQPGEIDHLGPEMITRVSNHQWQLHHTPPSEMSFLLIEEIRRYQAMDENLKSAA